MIESDIVCISVVRDFDLYDRLFRANPHVSGCTLVALDNRRENLPIPVRYNAFLDEWDDERPAWFVFCHEDFEFRSDIGRGGDTRLDSLAPDSLYGPIGCARRTYLGGLVSRQVFNGTIQETRRDGTGTPWTVGRPVPPLSITETFDCCCLIVHSSLVRRHRLRFDEQLLFDLYVEDFCAAARLGHGIVSRILPLNACHHSGSRPTQRLYRHLPYLAAKYPRHCFTAPCAYFGTWPWPLRAQHALMRMATCAAWSRKRADMNAT